MHFYDLFWIVQTCFLSFSRPIAARVFFVGRIEWYHQHHSLQHTSIHCPKPFPSPNNGLNFEFHWPTRWKNNFLVFQRDYTHIPQRSNRRWYRCCNVLLWTTIERLARCLRNGWIYPIEHGPFLNKWNWPPWLCWQHGPKRNSQRVVPKCWMAWGETTNETTFAATHHWSRHLENHNWIEDIRAMPANT